MTSFRRHYPGNSFHFQIDSKYHLHTRSQSYSIFNLDMNCETNQSVDWVSSLFVLCVVRFLNMTNVFLIARNVFEFWPHLRFFFWQWPFSLIQVIVRKWDDYRRVRFFFSPFGGIESIDYSKQIIWQFFKFRQKYSQIKNRL